jgi:hypothetical protein
MVAEKAVVVVRELGPELGDVDLVDVRVELGLMVLDGVLVL